MIFTFYSFKGGVGRSMALANVAELLYHWGLKVLIVDFDLEAPGLERYFNVPEAVDKPANVQDKRGVIDMLSSYKALRSLPLPNRMQQGNSGDSHCQDEFPFPMEPINNFIVPIYEATERGTLSIISAGRRSGDWFGHYAESVRCFDWDDFYKNWDGELFFEWFRKEVEKIADVVLIDSRTGITEMGGVCTYQLADVVVMFVAPNQQNLDGTMMMARSLSNPELIEKGRKGRSLSLVFVPSRVESGEKELLDKFEEDFTQILGSFIAPTLKFNKSAFIDLKVPYVPYYGYMENVAVREADRASASDLSEAFERLALILAQLAPEITILQQILKTNPLSQSYSSASVLPLQFQSLIADKTEGFVGRQFVFDAISEFLQKQPNGYFIIEADPGVGKSAILAEYVRRTGCVAYFNVRSQGITAASDFLKSVCTQLIERYNLPYKELHPDNTRDGNFLARLLDEIVRGNHALPLVIAVDALDEVDLNSQTEGANVLYLPASLPDGVFFILTKRPTPLPLVVNKQKPFDLMQYQAESLEDVQTYIRQRTNHSPSLQEWISSRGLAEEEFVTTLGEKSDRNFMYLRYVLPEIECGAYQDLNIENLPEGLEQYYYQHWQHMGMTAKPLPRTKIKIVYVLAEAIKPVSGQMICEFIGEDLFTVQEVLDDWNQFLREQRIEGQTRYSIYHASFKDFLHRQDIVQMAGVALQNINAQIAGDLLSKWKKRRDRE
jgi:MinD-like ATPase involved in chromosome partitioning or flagellar assembly